YSYSSTVIEWNPQVLRCPHFPTSLFISVIRGSLTMASQVRQNYHSDCEAAISRVVNMESTASYSYMSMFHPFRRDDVQSYEGNEHAQELREYHNKRGGGAALKLEEALLDLHKMASDRGDPHLCDILGSHFLNEESRMMVQATSSGLADVKSGDQKGAVLGPLLIYIYKILFAFEREIMYDHAIWKLHIKWKLRMTTRYGNYV
uniref:ferroxidase n=1 Tax=Erpetoichthys calabaricus TaxID=27687 RepID=A0A8C4XHA2_ERPCA